MKCYSPPPFLILDVSGFIKPVLRQFFENTLYKYTSHLQVAPHFINNFHSHNSYNQSYSVRITNANAVNTDNIPICFLRDNFFAF